jgi:hypothetical protein
MDTNALTVAIVEYFIKLNERMDPEHTGRKFVAPTAIPWMASEIVGVMLERMKDERPKAVADFVNRMSVVYRKHNAVAVQEDARLAVSEFGVDPVKAGWPVEWIAGSD